MYSENNVFGIKPDFIITDNTTGHTHVLSCISLDCQNMATSKVIAGSLILLIIMVCGLYYISVALIINKIKTNDHSNNMHYT